MKTYGYVGNAVYQIEKLLFAETKDEGNKIYYIGDYEPINIEEWANEIANMLGYRILRVPYFSIFLSALLGDVLKKLNIPFPMTSFRLHNMTTDNVIDLSNTIKIAPTLPFTLKQGIMETLTWMRVL
jgi:nucleoside-diphosphate-sugar epimerase